MEPRWRPTPQRYPLSSVDRFEDNEVEHSVVVLKAATIRTGVTEILSPVHVDTSIPGPAPVNTNKYKPDFYSVSSGKAPPCEDLSGSPVGVLGLTGGAIRSIYLQQGPCFDKRADSQRVRGELAANREIIGNLNKLIQTPQQDTAQRVLDPRAGRTISIDEVPSAPGRPEAPRPSKLETALSVLESTAQRLR